MRSYLDCTLVREWPQKSNSDYGGAKTPVCLLVYLLWFTCLNAQLRPAKIQVVAER